jgi:hypothetical protein
MAHPNHKDHAMFVDNSIAAQRKLFTLENELDERLKKKLAKHWSAVFFEKVFLGIDEKQFSPLYCRNNGRPNFPVNILVSMEILKEMWNLTDEQLFERYYFDFGFRRALGLTDFNEHIIAEKTLYNFRASLAQHDREHGTTLMEPVFRNLRDEIIQELGIKTGTQRTDSTLIGANIKKMSRLMLFHKTLSNLVRDMKSLEMSVSKGIEEILKEDEDRFTYRLKRTEYGKATQLLAGYLYRLVAGHVGDWRISAQQSYLNAQRLIDEQCHISKKKKVLLKEGKEISSSSMQNPADPDATYRKKNGEAHRGYAAHATETCDAENAIQVVMDVAVVKNNVDDATVLAEAIAEYKEDGDLEMMIADGAFVSDDVREACTTNDVTIVTSAIRGKTSDVSPDRLTSKDFTCDEQTGEILMCPAGCTPRSASVTDTTSVANFNPKKCARCKKRSLCPASVSKTQARYVIDDTRRWLDERHEALKTGEYQKLCKMRPPVEGLMSQIKPKYLNGRIRFRRIERVRSRVVLKGIGVNFKRYRAHLLDLFYGFLEKLFRIRYFDQWAVGGAN